MLGKSNRYSNVSQNAIPMQLVLGITVIVTLHVMHDSYIYAGNSYIHFSPHMILATDMKVQGYILFHMSDVIATLTLTLIVHSMHSSDSSVFALSYRVCNPKIDICMF